MLLSSLPRGPWWKALCCQRWSTVSLCVAIGMVSVCVKVRMRRLPQVRLVLDPRARAIDFAREVLFSSWRSYAEELWDRDWGLTLVCAFTNSSLSMYTYTSWEMPFQSRVSPESHYVRASILHIRPGSYLGSFFLLVCSSFAPTTLLDGQSRQGFPEMADEISEV